MIRADAPAFPTAFRNESDVNATAPDGQVVPPESCVLMTGMTIQERFAMAAMQGILASYAGLNVTISRSGVAQEAVDHADALLAELAKRRA